MNWHEDGAAAVATALLDRGIGIEAGIYSGTGAARRFLACPERIRIGLEDVLRLPDGTPAGNNADLIRAARDLVDLSRRRRQQDRARCPG